MRSPLLLSERVYASIDEKAKNYTTEWLIIVADIEALFLIRRYLVFKSFSCHVMSYIRYL